MISYTKQENPSQISKLMFRIIKISNSIIDYISRELPPISNNDFQLKIFLFIDIFIFTSNNHFIFYKKDQTYRYIIIQKNILKILKLGKILSLSKKLYNYCKDIFMNYLF